MHAPYRGTTDRKRLPKSMAMPHPAAAPAVAAMVNGRLFDAATMAEIGGLQRPAPVFF